MSEELKSKFRFLYLSRPCPVFVDTLMGACRKALKFSETRINVKLIEIGVGEVPFREILDTEKSLHVKRADDI